MYIYTVYVYICTCILTIYEVWKPGWFTPSSQTFHKLVQHVSTDSMLSKNLANLSRKLPSFAQKTSVLPFQRSKLYQRLLFPHVSSCFLQIELWLSLTVGLCWIRGQYFFVSWPNLLSIANWGTDCVVRMLLQKQVDLAGDIPIYRKNKCRSSFGIFILKILKINVGICWKSKNNFSTKIQRLPEPQTASKVPSSGSSTGKSTWSFARVLQRPLIVCVCVCACAYICAYIFLCACVHLCFYIYVCVCETLHDSCQTQLSVSLSRKMEKFSHSSFKEKVTSRRFSRRCYGDRSSQDHVAPPLKRRCSGGDGGGCLEHPGCGPTSYSYSFSSKDWTWDASRFMPDSTLSFTFLQDGEVQPFEFQREGHIEKIFSQMLWWQIKSRSCRSTP